MEVDKQAGQEGREGCTLPADKGVLSLDLCTLALEL